MNDVMLAGLRRQAEMMRSARDLVKVEMSELKQLVVAAHESGLGPNEIIKTTGLARETVFRTLRIGKGQP